MGFAVDSMGFGHGRCGKGPCGHGPWVTLPFTPGYPFTVTNAYDVDIATFEDLTEQRFLRAADKGLAFTYTMPRIDAVTHAAVSSWVQGCNGSATRFLALDYRTRRPHVVRLADDSWDVVRPVGVSRDTALAMRVERDVTYAEVVMADSPVAYWRCSDATGVSTAADATGNGFHGIIVGGVTVQQSGALVNDWDRAFRTTPSGTPANIRVGSLGVADGFTFECWFQQPTQDPTAQYLMSAFSNSGASWSVRITAGQIVTTQNTAATVFSTTSATYADSVWHHLVWARTAAGAANATVYIDGANVTGTVTSSLPTTAVQSCTIGSLAGVFGFNGYMDEIAVYTNALSASRVLEHYRAGVRT